MRWLKFHLLLNVFINCSKPLRGLLSKYTNVVKGWQYRWFVLYPDQGTVEYYEVGAIES